MMGLTLRLGAAFAVLALWAAGPTTAQENLDQGKTPAQLYTSDCAICHKSPHGLAKRAGLYGLDNFLREHYTASREAAAGITAYLQAIDRQAAPERSSKRKARASERKHPLRKPAEAKASETKSPPEIKASESKPSESKASTSEHEETKAAAPKTNGPKPAEHKKPIEAKAEAPKASPSKSAQHSKDATDSKDAKPDKSD
jgi:hypothetical protein